MASRKKSQAYQVDWNTPATSFDDLNKKLSVRFRQINELIQTLFDNALQPEEGNWTPKDQSGTSLAFANPVGRYIKLGPLVIATAQVTYPTTADTSTAIISGLPFRVDTTSADIHRYGSFIVTTDESTLARVFLSTDNYLYPRTTANAAITNATLSTNIIYFTVIYRTAQ